MKLPKSRAWRESRGLTRKELAEEAGLSPQTLASYESGNEARPNNARKLADALGVEVTDLLEETQLPKVQAPREEVYDPKLSDMRRQRYLVALMALAQNLNTRWEEELEQKRDAKAGEFSGWAHGVLGTANTFAKQIFESDVFDHHPDPEQDIKDALLRILVEMSRTTQRILDLWNVRIEEMGAAVAEQERREYQRYDQEFQRIIAENFPETANA